MIILPLTQRENGWHTEIAVSIHQQSFICPIQLKTECKVKFLVFLYTGDHNHEQNEPPPQNRNGEKQNATDHSSQTLHRTF